MIHRTPLLFALLAAWLASVAAGMAVMTSYSNTAEDLSRPPMSWPEDCGLTRAADRSTLLMFVHPRCPCSRASIRELSRFVSNCRERVDVRVLFVQPPGQPDEWLQTDLWRSANAIPCVRVLADVDGAIADRFAATASGQVVLYDAAGGLLFHGGLTSGRGHEGDNAGRAAIDALVRGEATARNSCPVFGCRLKNSR